MNLTQDEMHWVTQDRSQLITDLIFKLVRKFPRTLRDRRGKLCQLGREGVRGRGRGEEGERRGGGEERRGEERRGGCIGAFPPGL